MDGYPLLLLAVGIVTIVVLILRLRVNPFLALIGSALLVALLSPRVVQQTPVMDAYGSLSSRLRGALEGRSPEEVARAYRAQADRVGRVERSDGADQPRFEPLNAPRLVAGAFGEMMGKIGLVIALATVIGRALMDSGAADRIVRSCLRLFGEGRAAVGLWASGFLLAVPVFFDTVFLLLVPLARALRVTTGRDYLLYVMAIGSGASIAHSLVPPTPGPIGVAAALNVELGVTIVAGVMVGVPLSLVGLGYAWLLNRRLQVPLRQAGGATLEELEQRSRRPDAELPSLFASLVPIVLPVLLITAATVHAAAVRANRGLDVSGRVGGVDVTARSFLAFLGEPTVALLLSTVFALWLVASRRGMTRRELGSFTASALDEAGMILLVTCAGGAFGAVLKAVGVGEALAALSREWHLPLLVLAWALTALLKVAQGSATVAMITTATILTGILDAEQARTGQPLVELLGYHPVYLVMAVGCGSKVGSWMNDSGFWVVCKMGGLSERETLQAWSANLVLMGTVGLPLVALLAWLLPMV